ncbi:MAG: hypothetical protein U0354_15075 [Candidatus Sericytochromatia bacterium]
MNNKINLILISMMILSACQINPPVTQTKQETKVINNVLTPAVSNSTIISPVNQSNNTQDEELIKQIINSSPEYFPENDSSLDATVPNNGGVVFATVPNNGGVVFATVPNNGGVVFMSDPDTTEGFATKSLVDRVIDKVAETQPLRTIVKNKIKEKVKNIVKPIIKEITKPEKQYKISFNKDKTQAEVTIITTTIKEVSLESSLKPLKKNIKEESISKAILVKENGSWKLSQVSPSTTKLNNTQSKIKVESIKITINSKNNINKTTELDLEGFKNKTRLISLNKGDTITLEAKITNGNSIQENPLEVYARFSNTKTRIPMFDDGGGESILDDEKQISGDSIKNDDVYTVNLLLNNKKGVSHLVLEIRNPLTDNIQNVDNFNYITKSIPILIN